MPQKFKLYANFFSKILLHQFTRVAKPVQRKQDDGCHNRTTKHHWCLEE
jgi:hypothetical protein